MNSKAHFNPKSMKWIISLVVMIILSVAVIFGSKALYNLANQKYDKHYDIDFTIVSTESVDISSLGAESFDITAVDKALDADGNLVAYIVTGTTVGYNQESPIEMSSTISADGTLVCGIDIIHQDETEYLGVRITTDDFKNQFEGRYLPVVSSASSDKGSTIDVLSKSTISSEAVIDGVDKAVEFLSTAGFIEVDAE
jgi:Na+-translocating ferredoxin:NAD+ oxidoreductase RnfG subunit